MSAKYLFCSISQMPKFCCRAFVADLNAKLLRGGKVVVTCRNVLTLLHAPIISFGVYCACNKESASLQYDRDACAEGSHIVTRYSGRVQHLRGMGHVTGPARLQRLLR